MPDQEEFGHPRYYNQHPSGVECWTIAEGFGFNLGNAIKYIWRAGLKSEAGYTHDLRKAISYLQREIANHEMEVEPDQSSGVDLGV